MTQPKRVLHQILIAAKKNPFIAFLSIGGLLLNFAHLYFLVFPNQDAGGFLGNDTIFRYQHKSTFLYSIQWPVDMLLISYFVIKIKNNYIKDEIGITITNMLTITLVTIGVFFLGCTFWPRGVDLHEGYYYSLMILISFFIGYTFTKLPKETSKVKYLRLKVKSLQLQIKTSKSQIGTLIALIGKIRVHHFLKMAIKLETPQNAKVIDRYIEDFDKQTSETLRKVSDEI